MFKKACPESFRRVSSSPVLNRVEGKAAALLTRGAYSIVREHGKRATCLREAAPAKAGNAAGLPAVAAPSPKQLWRVGDLAKAGGVFHPIPFEGVPLMRAAALTPISFSF